LSSDSFDQTAGGTGHHPAAAGSRNAQPQTIVSGGLTPAESRKLKEAIAAAIVGSISERKLSRRDAAAIMGTGQDKVSLVFRRRLRGFSIERLFKFLLNLGHDIEIFGSAAPGCAPGHVNFSVRLLSPPGTPRAQ
jgi:predicted XRE-type DNA-binding protein